jgi:hypothetical protein
LWKSAAKNFLAYCATKIAPLPRHLGVETLASQVLINKRINDIVNLDCKEVHSCKRASFRYLLKREGSSAALHT